MRKFILLCGFCISASLLSAQNFYDMNTIQDIRIYFGMTNWDYQMDTANAGYESYLYADSVVINGTPFIGAGVRYKGNSSYSATRAKNPLHIKLDFTNNVDYQGYTDVKLANGFSDPSMCREVVAYAILRQYMDAPQSNIAKVYLNNAYYGVMTNDENIGDEFNEAHYYTSGRDFVKCNPQNAGPGSGNGSSLEVLGTDSTLYYTKYDKKDGSWKSLMQLIDTLKNYPNLIENTLDEDRTLWMLAFNDVLVNLDSYSGSFRQNYYLYKDHNNQWIPTIWDLNMCFGSFTMLGTGGALNLTSMRNMSPLIHETDAAWPLISKLLAIPQYKKMYIAHARTINNENFVSATYKTNANALHTLIDNAVLTDANYLSTYANFTNGLTSTSTGGGGPMGSTVGIYELMDSRATYLSGTSEFTAFPPTITAVTPSSSTPAFGSNVTINATVTNRTSVLLGYRYAKSDKFIKIAMYDDGAHGDGTSGDNIYGVSIPVNSLEIQYYIYAENANAGMFSPERAEHEFYSLAPTITMASSNDIAINEFLADNNSNITNEKGKHKDWIELYNKTGSALGLSNIYLSDDAANIAKWHFPTTAFIPANGYVLAWADDDDITYVEAHTNFNLNSLVDTILLGDGTSVSDNVSFTSQLTDQSMARCPNGSGTFQVTSTLTPRLSNICNVSVSDIEANAAMLVYPNPANTNLNIQIDNVNAIALKMQDVNGQVVYAQNASLSPVQTIDISGYAKGLYIVTVTMKSGELISKKVIIE